MVLNDTHYGPVARLEVGLHVTRDGLVCATHDARKLSAAALSPARAVVALVELECGV